MSPVEIRGCKMRSSSGVASTRESPAPKPKQTRGPSIAELTRRAHAALDAEHKGIRAADVAAWIKKNHAKTSAAAWPSRPSRSRRGPAPQGAWPVGARDRAKAGRELQLGVAGAASPPAGLVAGCCKNSLRGRGRRIEKTGINACRVRARLREPGFIAGESRDLGCTFELLSATSSALSSPSFLPCLWPPGS